MTSYSDKERFYMLQELSLRSTKFLQDVFRSRWKAEIGTTWEDDDEHRKNFLDGPGRTAYEKAIPPQKTMLSLTKVKEWPMSFICFVLMEFKSSINYKDKNSAIDKLCEIATYLANHLLQTINKCEYDEKKKIISHSLISLGMKDTDVRGWVKEIESVEASAAFKQMETRFAQAMNHVVKGLLNEASSCNSEAINIPNLLSVHAALAYQKRAGFYLVIKKNVDLALMDYKEALSINIHSWTAHQFAAKCHKTKNHVSLALYHYERAMVICPLRGLPDYDKCMESAFERTSDDPLKPTMLPLTAEEYRNMIKEENSYMDSIIPKAVVPLTENFTGADADDPGFEHAMQGFKYYYGWEVSQDFEKAVEHFRKSADCRNAKGMTALAKCYLNGQGVAKDSIKAYENFLKATKMCKTWPGLSLPIRGDHGVAEAQHCLGRLCFEEEAYHTAGFWYEWSMYNGHGYSATLYGNMIACGLVTEKDIKLAKMCWKEGVNLKAPTALKWLLRYYLNEMESDLAEGYYKYGRAAKNPIILSWPEKPFSELIAAIRKYRQPKENELIRFEQDCMLTPKGMTFIERLQRMEYYSDPNILRLENFLLTKPNLEAVLDRPMVSPKLTPQIIQEIDRRAKAKGKTAVDIAMAIKYAKYIREMFAREKNLTQGERLKILDWFYKIITTAHHIVDMLEIPVDKVLSNFEHLQKIEKNQKKGPIDEKLSICVPLLNVWGRHLKNFNEVVDLLKKGAQRYPNNIHYSIIIALLLKVNRELEESTRWIENGIEKDEGNTDLLFQLVDILHKDSGGKYIEANEIYYRQVITAAPKDHPKVPGAWYNIAYMHLLQFVEAKDDCHLKKESASKIKECLGEAAEAERHQLPCFLPNKMDDQFRQIYSSLEKQEQNEANWRKQVVSKLEKSKELFVRKHYLLSPTRKLLVRFHRRDFRKTVMMTDEEKDMSNLHEASVVPEMKQPTVQNVSMLKPITLQGMNVVDSYCFENREIELTVLDNSFKSSISIFCVVEDNNGDVIRLCVYNVDLTETTVQKFASGTRLAVMNPCMMVENRQEHNWLRVDGLDYIKFLERVKQMCGFCGEENASHSCPSCSQLYCGDDCLQCDVERHDHELICLLKPNPENKSD